MIIVQKESVLQPNKMQISANDITPVPKRSDKISYLYQKGNNKALNLDNNAKRLSIYIFRQ